MMVSVANMSYTSIQYVQNQTVKNEKYMLDLSHQYFTNRAYELIATMNLVLFDNEINSILNRNLHGNSNPQMFVDINARLNLFTLNNNIFIMIMIPNNDHFFSNKNYDNYFDIQKLQKHTPVLAEKPAFYIHWFDSQDDLLHEIRSPEGINEQMIVVGRKLTNYSGKTTGYMFAGITERNITPILGSDEYNVSRELLLVNGSNNIIFSTHPYNKRLSLLDNYWKNTEQETPIMEYEGENYIVVDRPLPISDWKLVSVTPYQEAAEQLDQAYTFNVFLQVVAFIFMAIILLYLINKFTQPITKLAQVAGMVEHGNLEIRSNIKRNDEIGRLSIAFDLMLERIESMIEEIKMEQKIKRKAEIAALQAKIKPHFIFNLLNTIRLQFIKNHDMEAAKITQSFIQFLRSIYQGKELITLQEEVNDTVVYLNLVNAMRKNPVEMKQLIVPETFDIKIPRLITQPIVENSCKHGFRGRDGRITMESKKENDFIYLSIYDNGIGMDEETLSTLKESIKMNKKMIVNQFQTNPSDMFGIGLKNVYERMILTYGEEADMIIESGINKGTKITLVFPI